MPTALCRHFGSRQSGRAFEIVCPESTFPQMRDETLRVIDLEELIVQEKIEAATDAETQQGAITYKGLLSKAPTVIIVQ